MKSAYPSSQSFFDASSDSISATDVEKCRTSSSFSSLSDLFARNPNGKSDLFSNVRTPVFVPAEVSFPSRKNRECEERVVEKVSLWHEWGSGECPGEESSGLLSDKFKSPSSELFRAPSSNLFPNLGSANVSVVPEEFTFPERRKREDESWREQRGFRHDWVPSVSTVDDNVRESTAMIGSVADFFATTPAKPSNLLSSSKPSLFSNLGTTMASQPQFPARRKRNENPFWKDYSNSSCVAPSECTTSGSSTSGVNSLSGLYSKPSSKCSSLFSNLGTTNVSSEDVVFPSRKKNPERNAWRDWSNTGYNDWAQADSDDENKAAASPEATQAAPASAEKIRSIARPLHHAATRNHRRDNSCNMARIVSMESTHNSVHSGAEVSTIPSGFRTDGVRAAWNEEGERQRLYSAGANSEGDARNAARSSECPVETGSRGTSGKEYGEKLNVEEAEDHGDSALPEDCYRSGRRDLHEQRISRQKVHDFPPPLGFLGRQGSLRVPHHLPWVQLQPVRSEGRFMLQEVKVHQPVVFEPIREQGRLVLQLIRQDGTDAQGCQIAFGDSSTVPEEGIAGRAHQHLEGKEKHLATTDDELDTMDRDLVKEKVRKANKFPKIYPEPSFPNESCDAIPKQAAEEPPNSSFLLGKSSESKEPVKEQTWVATFNDLAAGTSEKVVDDAGNEEIPVLSLMETDALRQTLPCWKASSVRSRDNDCQTSFKSEPRSCSLWNAMPKESGTLHRSRSIRNSALSEFGRSEGEKDEASKDRWRGTDDCFELRAPFVTPGQVFDTSLGLKSPAHFLNWSLRTRPEAPGDPELRLTNYPAVAASFLCADGVGKRHHEKSFWEQQPCVS